MLRLVLLSLPISLPPCFLLFLLETVPHLFSVLCFLIDTSPAHENITLQGCVDEDKPILNLVRKYTHVNNKVIICYNGGTTPLSWQNTLKSTTSFYPFKMRLK